MPRLPDALARILVVMAAFIGVVAILRFYILPASLTDMQLHKAATVERETALQLKYAGSSVCAECHEDQPAMIREGYHSTLSCEGCHGPAQAHVDDYEVIPRAPREREFCPLCHNYNPSKPTGFPQINPVAHNPMQACINCHEPHDPEPPEMPRECSGCHAEIARTKAISHHVGLECVRCHEAPAEHKVNPRSVRASKPTTRGFCGQCHGEESEIAETPKVNLATHGDRYLCWQCHYPHLPEGN